MSPVRVLSMDGGGIASVFTARLLQRIEEKRKGFLQRVHVMAGTSSGSIMAVLLATDEDPVVMLQKSIDLWANQPVFSNSPLNRILSLLGMSALFSNMTIFEYLTDIFGERTLATLTRQIVIPALELDTYSQGRRTWAPRIFHNLGGEDTHDRIVDVAMRSSAAPIGFPIYEGFADGGLFANNPSLVTATHLIEHRGLSWRIPSPLSKIEGNKKEAITREILMLSVGVGTSEQYIEGGTMNWGWYRWLLDIKSPFRVVLAAIQSGQENTVQMCQSLMGPGYFRFNPPTTSDQPHQLSTRMSNPVAQMLLTAADQTDLAPVLDWVDTSGWMKHDKEGSSP